MTILHEETSIYRPLSSLSCEWKPPRTKHLFLVNHSYGVSSLIPHALPTADYRSVSQTSIQEGGKANIGTSFEVDDNILGRKWAAEVP